MGFVVQYQSVAPNGSTIFNIPGSVSSYIVGISSFSLTFGYPNQNQVQQIGLSLELPGQPVSTQGQTQIEVTALATLSDTSGHVINNQESTLTVAMLAWTGAANSQVMLQSATVNNGQSSNLTVPSETPASGLQPMVSGFQLAYPIGVVHNVQTVDIGVSSSPQNPGYASLGATAMMHDASGNYVNGSGGTTANITGSLLATSLSSPGCVKQILLPQQTINPFPVDLGVPLTDAAVFVTGFQLQYPLPNDWWIMAIGAGTSGWNVSGSSVMLNGASAWMFDNSGHFQDDTASSVSLVVIGIPSSC